MENRKINKNIQVRVLKYIDFMEEKKRVSNLEGE